MFCSSIKYEGLESLLEKFQDPKQADAMTRVQTELDETKVILVILILMLNESLY